MTRKFTDTYLQSVQTQKDYYNNVVQADSDNLNAYIRLYLERTGLNAPSGLLPDVLCAESEYKRLTVQFKRSFANLRAFNTQYRKELRELHRIERGKRVWEFEFGNSIKDSEFVAVYGKTKYPIPENLRGKSNSEITLYVKCNLQSDFGHTKRDVIILPVAPSEYSILSCLTKYDPGIFENFCSEFGYDTDSKNAERTYNAVVKEWQSVCRMWTDEEIEQLQEIN